MEYKSFFGNREITIVKGKDQYVWDTHGNKYIDMHTGNGAAFLGHKNEYVIKEILQQIENIQTLSTSFNTPIREKMLEKLEGIRPKEMDYVSLLNSGSEAVDLALKISRKITSRKKFIAFKNSFHGRTFGALSVTWNPRYRKPFMPLIDNVEFLEFNNIEELKRIDNETAAVIIEPVQGEGGVYPASIDFLNGVYERCVQTNSLLIIDEIQCGFGRTGLTWTHEKSKAVADILLAGKGIGGGYPLSIVFYTEEIAKEIDDGDHGSTYGGNPLAMASIVGAIEAFEKDNVLEKVNNNSKAFHSELNNLISEFNIIRDIRILGLMIAIELKINASQIISELQKEFILALKSGLNIIRFLPPYKIQKFDIKETKEKILEILEKINLSLK